VPRKGFMENLHELKVDCSRGASKQMRFLCSRAPGTVPFRGGAGLVGPALANVALTSLSQPWPSLRGRAAPDGIYGKRRRLPTKAPGLDGD
jgi:hypothetical protein